MRQEINGKVIEFVMYDNQVAVHHKREDWGIVKSAPDSWKVAIRKHFPKAKVISNNWGMGPSTKDGCNTFTVFLINPKDIKDDWTQNLEAN